MVLLMPKCLRLCVHGNDFSGGSVVKNPPAKEGAAGHTGLISGLGRFPWRRAWKPAPVFLSGESDGQGSLVGYSPWGREELDMPENALTFTAVRTRESPKAEWPEAVRVMRLRWGSAQ